MRKVVRGLLTGGVFLTAALVAPQQATAATVSPGCSAGGFTGNIRVDYTTRGGSADIHGVSYKIYKGSQSGGNNANVFYVDHGTLPATRAGTNAGKQDNVWHHIKGPYSTTKSGGLRITFIFDKSLGADPECVKEYRLP